MKRRSYSLLDRQRNTLADCVLSVEEKKYIDKLIIEVEKFRKSIPMNAWRTTTITATQILPMFDALADVKRNYNGIIY